VLSLIATSSISSDPATVQLHRPNVPAIAKPNLYVLAIGIAKFETQRITPLSYTEDDAKAFVEHMTAQEGTNPTESQNGRLGRRFLVGATRE
jgi:hypothetical protein